MSNITNTLSTQDHDVLPSHAEFGRTIKPGTLIAINRSFCPDAPRMYVYGAPDGLGEFCCVELTDDTTMMLVLANPMIRSKVLTDDYVTLYVIINDPVNTVIGWIDMSDGLIPQLTITLPETQ